MKKGEIRLVVGFAVAALSCVFLSVVAVREMQILEWSPGDAVMGAESWETRGMCTLISQMHT